MYKGKITETVSKAGSSKSKIDNIITTQGKVFTGQMLN